MIICDKSGDMLFPLIDDVHASLFEKGALLDDEYDRLRKEATEYNEKYAIENSTTRQLIKELDRALAQSFGTYDGPSEEDEFVNSNSCDPAFDADNTQGAREGVEGCEFDDDHNNDDKESDSFAIDEID